MLSPALQTVHFQFLKTQKSKGCSFAADSSVPSPVHATVPPYTISLTKPLQSISHGLVFHHVDKSPPQAEVGEDEEDGLQDVIDVVQLLLRQK